MRRDSVRRSSPSTESQTHSTSGTRRVINSPAKTENWVVCVYGKYTTFHRHIQFGYVSCTLPIQEKFQNQNTQKKKLSLNDEPSSAQYGWI